MKRFTALFVFAVLLAGAIIPGLVFAQSPIQKPVGFVNDFADVIPADRESRLEQSLRSYSEQTSNEIAVVTIESLGSETVEQYTMRLAEEWKVGKKGKDNGVILLVAIKERKIRIETGYGVEGRLPDVTAKRIIDSVIVPEFKKNNYADGIEKAVTEIQNALAAHSQTSEAPSGAQESGGDINLWQVVLVAVFLLAAIGFVVTKASSADNSSVREYDGNVQDVIIPPMVVLPIGGEGAAQGQRRETPTSRHSRSSARRPDDDDDNRQSWSSGSSGGGDSGGGFDFGGGDFGGGGASGSW